MASTNRSTGKKNHSTSTNDTWKGAIAIIGSIIVEFALGSIYALGNISTYIVSYMRVRGISHDILYTSSMWISATSTVALGFFMFVSGFLEKWFGPRIATLIGSSLFCGSTALTYYSVQYSFPCLLLTYGFFAGIGDAVAYPIGLSCAMKWFPNKKATAVGIVMGGYGIAAFLWNPLITFYINPNNFSPDHKIGNEIYFSQPEVLDNVPSCFLVLGIFYACVMLLGALMISNPKSSSSHVLAAGKEDDFRIELDSESDFEERSNEDSIHFMKMRRKTMKTGFQQIGKPTINADYKYDILEEPEFYLSPRDVLKTRQFYLLWFILLLSAHSIDSVSILYKAYGQTFIKNDHFLSMTGAFASIANASGRVLWGAIGDRLSFKKAMLSLLLILTSLFSSLSFTEFGGEFMFAIWVFLIYLTFSGTFVLLPAITQRTFGAKHYLTNYGLIFTSQIIKGAFGSLLTIELKEKLGWHGMFLLSAGILIICAVFTCLFTKLKPSSYKLLKTNTHRDTRK